MNLELKLTAFENRLLKVWKHHSKWARKAGIACFRFYDHDLPEAPFAIEWLSGVVHVAEYRRKHGLEEEEVVTWRNSCKEIIARVVGVEHEAIFLKERFRKTDRQDQYQKQEVEKVEHIVREADLSFILNLTEYLDTGLFLDHRITRGIVGGMARGKNVLNLFCYTGSFSVYAAKGEAASVTSVDLSKTYINWAKRNMQYNKLYEAEKHVFVQADVLDWVSKATRDSYDLIICDPPTFSNSQRMETEWEVQRDHVSLMESLSVLLKPSGTIIFSNNRTDFEIAAEQLEKFIIKDITAATTPPDFGTKLRRKCFQLTLKS